MGARALERRSRGLPRLLFTPTAPLPRRGGYIAARARARGGFAHDGFWRHAQHPHARRRARLGFLDQLRLLPRPQQTPLVAQTERSPKLIAAMSKEPEPQHQTLSEVAEERLARV